MKRLYRLIIDFWWNVEHIYIGNIAIIGYRERKKWEHKYVDKFNENIYGEAL